MIRMDASVLRIILVLPVGMPVTVPIRSAQASVANKVEKRQKNLHEKVVKGLKKGKHGSKMTIKSFLMFFHKSWRNFDEKKITHFIGTLSGEKSERQRLEEAQVVFLHRKYTSGLQAIFFI